MANYLKEHAALRIVLIAAAFLAGMGLIFIGWRMTGLLSGFLWMLAGLALVLAALWLYNLAYKN